MKTQESKLSSNQFIPYYMPEEIKNLPFKPWKNKYMEDCQKKDMVPQTSCLVELDESGNKEIIRNKFETIKDERGEIRKIAQNVDVLQIVSLKGSRRAAHYHKKTAHLCKLLSGSMTYYEREVIYTELAIVKPTKLEIKPGDYFYTGPCKEHLMVFNEDSIFDCYSYGSRNREDYENDLVRIPYDLEEIYNNWKD